VSLGRDDVVRAAVELLDEVGLAKLTLRRLAERLEIKAPTLYWHVRNKRELLDLMAAAIMGEAVEQQRVPRPDQPWWEWLDERARVMRNALLAHRDGALVVAGNRPTVASLPGIERQLDALVEAGFTPRDALLSLLAISAYVIGETLEVQADAGRVTAHEADQADPPASGLVAPDESIIVARLLATGSFPTTVAALSATAQAPGQRFDHGLSALIAGLRAQRNP
jgi:TetR/AcrR family tetracycline transcriptional repressor